jgi:hypothetical protein
MLRISRAIPPLPLFNFMVCTGTNVPFSPFTLPLIALFRSIRLLSFSFFPLSYWTGQKLNPGLPCPCFHHSLKKIFIYPDDGDSMTFWNVSTLLPDYSVTSQKKLSSVRRIIAKMSWVFLVVAIFSTAQRWLLVTTVLSFHLVSSIKNVYMCTVHQMLQKSSEQRIWLS